MFLVGYLAWAAGTARQEFRTHLVRLAQGTLVGQKILRCRQSVRNNITGDYAISTVELNLEIQDASAEFKEAFFVRFFGEQNRMWSTLVAYEGQTGNVLGTLERRAQGESVRFTHTVNGYFNDTLALAVIGIRPIEITYRKMGPQGLEYFSIVCSVLE